MSIYLNGTGGVEKVSIDGEKVKNKLNLETYKYTLTLPTQHYDDVMCPTPEGTSPSLLVDGKTVIQYKTVSNSYTSGSIPTSISSSQVYTLSQYDILKDEIVFKKNIKFPNFEIPNTSINIADYNYMSEFKSIIIQNEQGNIYLITERQHHNRNSTKNRQAHTYITIHRLNLIDEIWEQMCLEIPLYSEEQTEWYGSIITEDLSHSGDSDALRKYKYNNFIYINNEEIALFGHDPNYNVCIYHYKFNNNQTEFNKYITNLYWFNYNHNTGFLTKINNKYYCYCNNNYDKFAYLTIGVNNNQIIYNTPSNFPTQQFAKKFSNIFLLQNKLYFNYIDNTNFQYYLFEFNPNAWDFVERQVITSDNLLSLQCCINGMPQYLLSNNTSWWFDKDNRKFLIECQLPEYPLTFSTDVTSCYIPIGPDIYVRHFYLPENNYIATHCYIFALIDTSVDKAYTAPIMEYSRHFRRLDNQPISYLSINLSELLTE